MNEVSWRGGASFLLVALLLAGCFAEPAAERSRVEDEPHEQDDIAREWTYYFGGAGSLETGTPMRAEPERIPVASFPRTWGEREGFPTFHSLPLSRGLVVTSANVTVHAEPRGAVASTMRFVEWIAYAGPERYPMGVGSVRAEPVHASGEVREFTIPVTLPRGGLVLLPGERLEVIVFPVQTQEPAIEPVTLDLLVNSTATPGRIDVVAEEYGGPRVSEGETRVHEGILLGSAYAGGEMGAGYVDFEVPEGGAGFVARLLDAEGAGFRDVDLDAYGPSGELVAGSHTPYRVEGIRILAPNLEAGGGPGTWTIKVASYGSAAATYRVELALLSAIESVDAVEVADATQPAG